jgi:hypothetical protein
MSEHRRSRGPSRWPLRRSSRGLRPINHNPEGCGGDATTAAARTSAGASKARTQGARIAALSGKHCAVSAAVLVVAVVAATTLPSAGAETVQHDNIRINFRGGLTPKRLPRSGAAPVEVSVAAKISGVGGTEPPALRKISLSINKEGAFDRAGLPVCTFEEVQPTTDPDALRACGKALVGEGRFSAQVGFSGQAPFPSEGKILAFNGTYLGRPAILAHVFGTSPVPTSYTLPFLITPLQGTFGTLLSASLPDTAGTSGYITGLSLELGRNFTVRGSRHSYISAGCPAPKGFPGATFPFVHATFAFAGGEKVSSTITRNCRAVGR